MAKSKATQWSDTTVAQIFNQAYVEGLSSPEIEALLGVPQRTVRGILSNESNQKKFAYLLATDDGESLEQPVTLDQALHHSARLQKRIQGYQDRTRVERKVFREHARKDNLILAMQQAIIDTLEANSLTKSKLKRVESSKVAPVGVVQFSDIHFNELIDDLDGNQYNFEIASQRVRKHVSRAISYFTAFNITDVAVFCTGDLLNSDRRLDEITNAAENRSKAIFLAVDILQQAILELSSKFNVTVASITGNESRVGEFVHYSNFLAGDSYDVVIHNMLTYVFKGVPRVTFIPVTNPLEQVVNLNGVNFLLVHGHAHRGLAATGNLEREVIAIKAKYGSRGVNVDYVICGHIHSAYISDNFARSSGMPGNNAYSERALNLNGKASQNLYLVWQDKSIDGVKVDLQNTDGIEGYPFDQQLKSYATKGGLDKSTVVIQSVLV